MQFDENLRNKFFNYNNNIIIIIQKEMADKYDPVFAYRSWCTKAQTVETHWISGLFFIRSYCEINNESIGLTVS